MRGGRFLLSVMIGPSLQHTRRKPIKRRTNNDETPSSFIKAPQRPTDILLLSI